MQINPKNHLSCSRQYDEVYGFSAKRNNYKLEDSSVRKAITLLFGMVTPKQEQELIRIARSMFAEHNSVVWMSCSYENEFNEFLKKNSLDIGRKEVIILDDGKSVQYTEDYHYYPRLVD